jgi:acetyltransferase-like isoleucine patch superfamily enzyme
VKGRIRRAVISRLGYVSGSGVALWVLNTIVQRVFRIDGDCRYGKHFTSRVLHSRGLEIEHECDFVRKSLAVSGGCYISAADGLWIGEGTIWSANVAIVSQTHATDDFRDAPATAGIRIGRACWIGFGAVILPGVVLGDHTIVGANSVVTRSFADGHVVIAGAPAIVVKTLDGTPPKHVLDLERASGFDRPRH